MTLVGHAFDPGAYGGEVARILALDGAGQRRMPLALGACSSEEARRLLLRVPAAEALFPRAAHPRAALSGLWLYFSCRDESHMLAQSVTSPEGSFWHGIVHRQEPDPGNAAYWFRLVGEHAVFPALVEEASRLATEHPATSLEMASRWDPFAFIDFCEEARGRPGSPAEALALDIQRAEWQLLFDYCARAERSQPH